MGVMRAGEKVEASDSDRVAERARERERDRETDRQTDRDRERERDREKERECVPAWLLRKALYRRRK